MYEDEFAEIDDYVDQILEYRKKKPIIQYDSFDENRTRSYATNIVLHRSGDRAGSITLEDPIVLSDTHSRPVSSTKFEDEAEKLKQIDSVKIFGSTYDRKEGEAAQHNVYENLQTTSLA